MSKNLEEEYKEYIQMETPDLWDRIERELSFREQPASEKVTKKRKKNIRKWTTYGSLAAAALVVTVVLPFLNGGMKSEETSADMSVMDTAGCTVVKENTAVTADGAADMEVAEAADEMTDSNVGMDSTAEAFEVTVTIVEIGVTDDGTVFYTGVTESGEYYSFTIAEGVEFVTENSSQIEGERYRVELVLDGEMYRATGVWD